MDEMTAEKRKQFACAVQKSAVSGNLVNVVFHAPAEGDVLKAKGVLKIIGGKPVLQMEKSCTEGRVTQENIPLDRIAAVLFEDYTVFRKADLYDKNGSASYMTSSKGKVTVLVRGSLKNPDYGAAPTEQGADNITLKGNDNAKRRLLTGSEPFLRLLDIADQNGRVHDKKQAKFRQICRFTEYIKEAAETLPDAGKGGSIYVCDLCCGKSYLSFAAYYCLSEMMGFQVVMVCVDLKKSVIDDCAETAKRCGFDGMRFLCMDINDFEPEFQPDMVISLHACDTATDVVLDFAARHQAKIILSTPCCHHEMKKNLNCGTLDFIARRPVLKQKLCDAATDALRLLKLEAEGYRVDATEFIDPEDTPKNVMLRAHRRKSFPEAEKKEKTEEYRAAYQFLYGREPGDIGFIEAKME